LAGICAALAEGFIQDHRAGCGDVEGADASGHGDAEQMVAGAADEIVQSSTFAAKDEHAVTGKIELIVVGGTALVEADDPEVLLFEVFEGADEVDDTGDAEMLGGTGAGLDGHRAERSGAALGEDDAIDAGTVGYAKEGAQVLRVLNAIESQNKAGGRLGGTGGSLMEVLDGVKLLAADQRDHALMRGGLGHEGQLLTRLLANTDTGLATERDELFEPFVLALASYQNLVKTTPASLDSFLNRMHPIKNFHEG
jgi:hypothetical protein